MRPGPAAQVRKARGTNSQLLFAQARAGRDQWLVSSAPAGWSVVRGQTIPSALDSALTLHRTAGAEWPHSGRRSASDRAARGALYVVGCPP